MAISDLITRLSFIFSGSNKDRFRVCFDKDGSLLIVIDYHKLKVCEARKYLNNIIAILRGNCRLEIIHGYNHGTAIKSMIWGYKHERIIRKSSPAYNPGVTFIDLSAVA